MFRRLDKFDGPIYGVGRGAVFAMLIGLHIWGDVYSRGGDLYTGGTLMGFYGI